jgi:hypothetical protein
MLQAPLPPIGAPWQLLNHTVGSHSIVGHVGTGPRGLYPNRSLPPMFTVVRVPDQAADLVEPLGTKPKFWFRDDRLGDCLFKEARERTGDDWCEKVASELSGLLGLPHAAYELATWRGKRGVLTPTFVPRDGRLVLGNELMGRIDPRYPKKKFFRVRQHTLRIVMAIIRQPVVKVPIDFTSFGEVHSALDVLVGYLMLDAWIANQDRHHENWGLVVTAQRSVHLTPSYDHASSLGTNETDENRKDRLTTRDRGRSMERYVARARSAFFASPSSHKPLSTLEAFQVAARLRPSAARAWLERLKRVAVRDTRSLLESVPSDRITPVAIDFAQRMLELNYDRLLALQEL